MRRTCPFLLPFLALLALWMLLALVVFPASEVAADQTFAYHGRTVGKPRWERPEGVGPELSTRGAVRYEVQSFFPSRPSVCNIFNTGNYDTYLHLYEVPVGTPFDPEAPLKGLIAGADDGTLGLDVQSAELLGVEVSPLFDYHLVTSGFDERDEGSYTNVIQCEETITLVHGTCTDIIDETEACIGPEGRFRIRLRWTSPTTGGFAKVAPFSTPESALLYFFTPNNWEMLIKVLDTCSFDTHFWLFFSAGTNVGFDLTVEDTVTGEEKVYSNALGNPAQPVQDTRAFPCP
jgi:hypothetical protein